MADQDKLEAVVDLGDEVILLYKDPAQKQPEDNASFTGIKDFESLRFQRTDGPYVLWPAKDGMGSYTKGLIMPDCLKQGWRLEVGGMKYPITVKGQGSEAIGDCIRNGLASPPARALLPFVNRELEVLEFFIIQINNLLLAGDSVGKSSNQKYILPIASHMYGAGKTSFGENVLQKGVQMKNDLETYGSLKSPRFPEYTFADVAAHEMFDAVASAQLALFDFRYHLDHSGNLVHDIRRNLIRLLLYVTGDSEADKQVWSSMKYDENNCGRIIKYFGGKYDMKFFIHVDEIQEIEQLTSTTPYAADNKLAKYYMVWNELHTIMQSGHLLYFSGRSSAIHDLGKGLKFPQSDATKRSPALVFWLNFGPFDDSALAEIYRSRNNKFQVHQNAVGALYKVIRRRTGCVPRLVTFGFLMLDEFGRTVALADLPMLFGQHFVSYLLRNMPNEMNISSKLNDNSLRNTYVNLLLLAAYRVPIGLANYPRSELGLQGHGHINILELVELVDLFTSSTPPEGGLFMPASNDREQVYLVFPEVVLDHLATTNMDLRLPLYAAIYKQNASRLDMGTILESLVKDCLVRRLHRLAYSNNSWEQLFPWLKHTQLGSTIAKIQAVLPFPKVTNKGQDCGFVGNEYAQLQDTIQNYLRGNPIAISSLQIHPKYWRILVDNMVPNVLYSPDIMSKSADLLLRSYVVTTVLLLQFQMKAGRQEISESDIGKELAKSAFNAVVNGAAQEMVFVVVAISLHREIQEKMEQGYLVYRGYTFHYTENHTQKSITLPPNIVVIVLGSNAVDDLLLPTNANFLRAADYNIDRLRQYICESAAMDLL